MFQETLLESSSTPNRRRGWSLATAFTAQTVIAAVLIVVPLLSSAVITISTPAMPVPISYAKPAAETQRSASGSTSTGVRFTTPQEVVSLDTGTNRLNIGNPTDKEGPSGPNLNPCVVGELCPVSEGGPPNLLPPGTAIKPEPPVKRIVSRSSEALLINKVIPTYPMIAVHAGVQGEVKLHAIIATDGTIQSLSVISGHPLLTGAALEAVRQWRYKPYFLNGQAVEVDTYITVNFKKGV